jgi:hypothetical protein
MALTSTDLEQTKKAHFVHAHLGTPVDPSPASWSGVACGDTTTVTAGYMRPLVRLIHSVQGSLRLGATLRRRFQVCRCEPCRGALGFVPARSALGTEIGPRKNWDDNAAGQLSLSET